MTSTPARRGKAPTCVATQDGVEFVGLAPEKTIVLVGLMGAGKSCIGRRLAVHFGLKFADADHEIVEAAGCSIPDIFSLYGEKAFRDGETRVIARLLDGPAGVLATGGGAFMNEATRNRIKDDAISVWLRADLDVLAKRVARRNDRPLLKTGNPRDILQKLMAERYPTYAEADIVVDSFDAPPDEMVDRVLDAIGAYLQGTTDADGQSGSRKKAAR